MSRTIMLNLDRPRELRLDYNDLSALDDAVRETNPQRYGIVKSLLMIGEGDFNFGALRTFYFHALRSTEKGMNPIRAGRIIQEALDQGMGFAELANNALLVLQGMGVLQVEVDDEEQADEGEDAHPTPAQPRAETTAA
jgi:hypothetical protein